MASESDRPGGASSSGSKPTDAPPRAPYPTIPAHVMERIAGYIGPGLRNQMARLREGEHVKAA